MAAAFTAAVASMAAATAAVIARRDCGVAALVIFRRGRNAVGRNGTV
jgi:hypothetical protein